MDGENTGNGNTRHISERRSDYLEEQCLLTSYAALKCRGKMSVLETGNKYFVIMNKKSSHF